MASRTTICSPGEVLTALGKSSTATDAERGLVEMLLPLVDDAIKDFLGWEVIQNTYTHLLPDIDLFQISANDMGQPVDVVSNRIAYAFPGVPVILQVPEIPLRSVTSIYADYSSLGGMNAVDFPANTLQVAGTDFYIDWDAPDLTQAAPPFVSGVSWSGHIRRWIGVWPARQRSIKVTYVAGITPDELDGVKAFPARRVKSIKYAAIIAAQAAFRQMQAWSDVGGGGGSMGPIVTERVGDAQFSYHEDAVAQATGFLTTLPMASQQLLRAHQRVKY